jgi:L-alanine-DL-glutamate epimerase-like enolase superfamily enzyme
LERRGAVDAVNVKLQQAGGILPGLRAVEEAGAAGRPVGVGSMVASGVGTAAGLHLALASPAVEANDLVGPFLLEDRVTAWTPWPPRLPARGPGLGVPVDRKRLEDHRVGERVVADRGRGPPLQSRLPGYGTGNYLPRGPPSDW